MPSTINENRRQRLIWVVTPLVIGLLVPSLVIFFLAVFIGHISPSAAAVDILRRQFSEGDNLFLLAAVGLIPFAALSATCAVAASGLTPTRLACLGIGGLIGILVLMIPGHISVWYPLYGPGRMSSTAVLAFLFIPFYCLVTLVIGLLGGWLVSLLPIFRHENVTRVHSDVTETAWMRKLQLKQWLTSPPGFCGLLAIVISGFFISQREVEVIQNSTSSTAAIGYLFLPLTVLILGMPWFLVGATVGYGYQTITRRQFKETLIFLLGVIFSTSYIYHEVTLYREERDLITLVATIEKMSSAEIDTFLTQSEYRDNRFALGAVAQNTATSSAALDQIANIPQPELHKAMGAAPEIMGKNRKGLAVMRLVALHPNVTPDTLSVLSQSPVDYVMGTVAGNPLTPVEDLERMFSEQKGTRGFYMIEWGLASNPRTPLSIIKQLARSNNEYTLRKLKSNPSTPEGIKAGIPHTVSSGQSSSRKKISNCSNSFYEKKDYEQAFISCVTDAESGDIKAQSILGYLYENNLGVDTDYEKAVYWYQAAADRGDRYSQYKVAQLYRTGKSGVQDTIKAVEYYKLAAQQGHPEAQMSLGVMYFQGSGTDVDMDAARYWWEKAKSNGVERAESALKRIP